jgi:two-component system nitrogen regulation sensor histidine kinase GlnL
MTKPSPTFPAPEWTSVSADMAASLAHEIRNPLLSIKGAAQLLTQSVGADDVPLAELIVAEVARIEQLVATLDPLTPNPPQVMQSLNIHEVTEYVRLAAQSFAPEVKFITDYDPSLPLVLGVRESLIQALLNLMKNAAEAICSVVPSPSRLGARENDVASSFSLVQGLGRGASDSALSEAPPSKPSPARGEGFTPTITTRFMVGERMQRADGGKLPIAVSIADNGLGVAEAIIPRLFTPFTTDKAHGKGLGLAIVAKIIEEHAGLIAHDRPANGGARFTMYLPSAS